MFLSGKNDTTILSNGTGVQSGKLAAQMMGFQSRVVEIFRHAPQGRFDLRLQRGILPDHTAKRPFKFRREDKFAHGSFGRAQTGNDTFSGLTLELAGAKSPGRFTCFRRRFQTPRLDATLAQNAFEHFLLIGRQRLGLGQNAI
jgi:hypothetical protein